MATEIRSKGFSFTITMERRDTGERFSREIQGGLYSGALAAFLDKYDARVWRVVSISTPATILRDLQGSREQATVAMQWDGTHSEGLSYRPPEDQILGQIGRRDHG